MRVPVSGEADIKITDRGGRGMVLYQATSRIQLSNQDIIGLVDAIVEIASQNIAGRARNRQQDNKT